MVASPNVDFGGAAGLANFLQDQQRQIDELTRQSRYPFSAGPLGTFQIFPDPAILDAGGKPVVNTVLKYGDGTTALSIRPGAALYGSKQQMLLRDLSGNIMYATDEAAGYGLASPLYTYFMAPIPGVALTAGVESEIAHSEATLYNPAWYSQILVRNFTTVTSLSVRFAVTDGTTTVASSAQTVAGPAFVGKMVLLPSSFMNQQNVVGKWLVTPNISGSVEGWPTISTGYTKSRYDLSPSSFH